MFNARAAILCFTAIAYQLVCARDTCSADPIMPSSHPSTYSMVHVTVPNKEVGHTLAKELVGSELAACVNIVPGRLMKLFGCAVLCVYCCDWVVTTPLHKELNRCTSGRASSRLTTSSCSSSRPRPRCWKPSLRASRPTTLTMNQRWSPFQSWEAVPHTLHGSLKTQGPHDHHAGKVAPSHSWNSLFKPSLRRAFQRRKLGLDVCGDSCYTLSSVLKPPVVVIRVELQEELLQLRVRRWYTCVRCPCLVKGFCGLPEDHLVAHLVHHLICRDGGKEEWFVMRAIMS